ncbi:hypothetical protein SADUNF_Sadunf13G0102000 [Salix dunnii]|uniref:Protein kinase domain-containing protein n=1 Tax=Salix dunnii TaxID=1413687 RepID=A0A835JGG2_9ROSI|nr:hypothetical protein SADUNF_Sadunf13G0102000 [Salix dunnii]
MGCIASKENSQDGHRERLSRKGSLDRRVSHVNSLRKDDGVRSKDKSNSGDVKVMLTDKKTRGSRRYHGDRIEKRPIEKNMVENYEVDAFWQTQIEKRKLEVSQDFPVLSQPAWGKVPKCVEAEQVAAGWPSWLASVAGEAIMGWVPRRANTFEKLDRIGQGTYSNVYKARDVTHGKIVAIKKVRFDSSDPESVKFMSREILILRVLDHPNIIKLQGLITSQTSSSLYLVFEYMEHDLTGLAALPGVKFTEAQIKCYMQQLLNGLDHCHSRGVLHRDVKGSNLLIDDNGILKIADFGLASFFDPQSSAPLTSRVVTLWYRAPELLLGASRYGVAVDLWSAGCILGELYSGRPILPGRTEVEQLHKIFKLCGSPSEDYWIKTKLPRSSVIKTQRPYRRCVNETFKDFPAPAVGLMENLLSMDPAHRGTAAFALTTEFFTTKPFACDPSSLPKYPPSKEIDAKLRDEEARRQEAAARRSGPREALASNGYPDLPTSLQKKHNSVSHNSGKMGISYKEQTVSGQRVREGRGDFMERSRQKVSHSGPLVQGNGWTRTGKNFDNHNMVSGRHNLSTISGLVATRTILPGDHQEKPGVPQPEVAKQVGRLQGSINGLESSRRVDQNGQIQKMRYSPQAGAGKSSNKEPSLHGHGPQGNKIYLSGPLLAPSNNVEQMLKEHDRQIQEFARRRLEKTKLAKAQGKQPTDGLMVTSRH